mmetsp:Transcript_22294/g.31170  ORF Transcript_22294/g.31170 Transcript_22294/m.31170 type:complete len:261 (-) Transcript_22294:105-887(-)
MDGVHNYIRMNRSKRNIVVSLRNMALGLFVVLAVAIVCWSSAEGSSTSSAMIRPSAGKSAIRMRVPSIGAQFRRNVRVCAEDEDFDARLEKIQSAGRRMVKEGPSSEGGKKKSKSFGSNPYQKKEYDFSNEVIFYEGPPHRGDAVVNSVLGATLVWLPLTVASLTRAVSIKYIISDKRVSVITKAPWDDKETRVDAPYDQIKKVQSVGRGIGLWGDMAVTTMDNNVLELRSLDGYKDAEKYINEKIPQRDEFEEEEYQTY